ncbi:dihydroorotase [Helicobacter muridarum]|uniref:Dihydroorotase n=1 Tax=Helicobacter muridarum TaxID=216 RepID=A0A099U174_9HELI|nr:dihydroorotase [Helicobacter muridarum]TLD98781.1 dihydroorotase [Helicobacter muridarum]STQ85454.1 dihydroorotase [Helicobacter muridarum]
MQTLCLTNPLDMHIHLRQNEVLESVLPFSARNFSLVLAMPNLTPPLFNVESVMQYRDKINHIANKQIKTDNTIFFHDNEARYFMPFMSLFISDSLTKEEIYKANDNGIRILKLYPKGSTTNSKDGLSEILNPNFLRLLEIAQDLNMILSIHGESAGFSIDREREFLVIFEELARSFPKLKIIIEHLSDRHSLESIHKYPNLFGTITLHHALLTLDDILGNALNPFAFCKPIVKTPKDRDAILEAMLNADSKISFGSDSAPHSIQAKYQGAAGIFSAPYILESLATIFDKYGKLDNLQHFISNNAMKIYDLSLPFTKTITLQKQDMQEHPSDILPCSNGDIKIFLPSFQLNYKIINIEVTSNDT